RLREVAERLYLEPATVSPLIGRLESAGLVTRSRSVDDERAVDIALTEAGVALRERALRVPGEVVERLGYSVQRLERLRDELTSLLEAAHAVN
ncbi:MAG TPA: MarR family transcriptional regulator, partial [Agromyces sp.]